MIVVSVPSPLSLSLFVFSSPSSLSEFGSQHFQRVLVASWQHWSSRSGQRRNKFSCRSNLLVAEGSVVIWRRTDQNRFEKEISILVRCDEGVLAPSQRL
jgi:hypothetical protein